MDFNIDELISGMDELNGDTQLDNSNNSFAGNNSPSSFESSNLDLNDWISLKDYANQIGVSYEAVRQQVNKNSESLGNHIRNIGKTRFIDSEAIAILSVKKPSGRKQSSQNKPVISDTPVDSITEIISEENIDNENIKPILSDDPYNKPIDVENDMIDERWTVYDYRLKIKILSDRLQNIEHEFNMMKTIFAAMSPREFKLWKKQQKQEWFDQYSISSQEKY